MPIVVTGLQKFQWYSIVHCNRPCISTDCWDNGPQIYRRHDFDLSWSHDVISQMPIWFVIFYFLLVICWNQASISSCFRHTGP